MYLSFLATYLLALTIILSPNCWSHFAINSGPTFVLYSFIFFLWLTTFWSDASLPAAMISITGNALLIVTWLTAISYLMSAGSHHFERFFAVPILSGGVISALVSVWPYSVDFHTSPADADFIPHRLSLATEGLSNPVLFAMYLGTGLIVAIYFGGRKTGIVRYFSVGAMLIITPTLFLTSTASVFVGLVMLPVWLVLRRLIKHATVVMASAAILVALLATLTPFVPRIPPTPFTAYQQDAPWERIYPDEYRIAYGGRNADIMRNESGNITLRSEDPTSGLVTHSFAIDSSKVYYLRGSYRTSVNHASGFYMRIQESDSCPRFISRHANNSHEDVSEADREVTLRAEDLPTGTRLTQLVVPYLPTHGTQCASILILNWAGIGSSELEFEPPVLYSHARGPKQVLEGLILDVLTDVRVAIWRHVLKHADGFILWGRGVAHDQHLVIKESRVVEHPHSLYVSTFYHSGIVGLVILVSLILLASKQVDESPDESLLPGSIMIYGLVTLIFDGGNLLTKFGPVWLMFWLPLGLILLNPRRGSVASEV